MTSRTRRSLPLALGLMTILMLGACGGETSDLSSPQSDAPGTTAPPDATAAGLDIEVTEFGPSGGGVYVAFQIDNPDSRELRFEWASLALTAPDGSQHRVYRDPSSPSYQAIAPGNSYADGGTFQIDPLVPGRYKLTYEDRVLEEKDL